MICKWYNENNEKTSGISVQRKDSVVGMKILVIGGVAAGTKAAAKLMRENRDNDVTILTKSADISYAGCGLPYYVGNVIENKSELIVNTPQSFSKLTGAKVLTETEVTKVDTAAKTVKATDLKTGEESEYSYDKLVIACGAAPVKPPIEGIDKDGVFYMRTPQDAISLRERVESGEINRAVVVGGGFIGIEVAENLHRQGVRVSVIEMADTILPMFDEEFSLFMENSLADSGIMPFTKTQVVEILGDEKVEKIKTNKRAMKTDAVIMSVGIRPATKFLEGSGIDMMPNGTIKTDASMKTNVEDVYAVGDCACVYNEQTGAPEWSAMGSSANIEGRIAAKSISGEKAQHKGVLGTAVVKLPDLNAGRTGLGYDAAVKNGFDAISAVAAVDDKAHYYPGAGAFIIKLIADKKTHKLLGAQVMGKGAVDKIIDIAVTGISLGATVEQLEGLDFAYAPPFSTAIHPISHALNVLINKLNGELESITPLEYLHGGAEGYRVLDVSKAPNVEGADFVDFTEIKDSVEGYGKDEKILLVCNRGRRAYLTQNILKSKGYTNTRVLEGGTTVNTVEV